MNRIKELREDRDLRQSDVAIATGIDQRTLSNYETGKTNPDSESIIRLCNFFKVTSDYLLCLTDINLTSTDKIFDELELMKKRLEYIQRIVCGNHLFKNFDKSNSEPKKTNKPKAEKSK